MEINQFDINKKATGYWENYYTNGQIANKGHYKNSLMQGYWEYYYTNGELWVKGCYKDSSRIGYFEQYLRNKKIKEFYF